MMKLKMMIALQITVFLFCSMTKGTVISFSHLPNMQDTIEGMEIHNQYTSLGVNFFAPITEAEAHNNTSIDYGGLLPGGPNRGSDGYITYGGTLDIEFTVPVAYFGVWLWDVNPTAKMNVHIYDTSGIEIDSTIYSSSTFYTDYSYASGISKVSLEGGKIYTSYYSGGWNYDGWTIDNLTFAQTGEDIVITQNKVDYNFDGTIIPEPATMILLGLGTFALRKRRA